jgi:hypothetical protein
MSFLMNISSWWDRTVQRVDHHPEELGLRQGVVKQDPCNLG